jgi:hypothetical protein
MELHFFPGQNLLGIKKGNFYVSRYEAWGGPSAVGLILVCQKNLPGLVRMLFIARILMLPRHGLFRR